jgi:hypothetical protein
MCGRTSHSTSLPEPSGPFDERFVYGLTEEGRKALAASRPSNGKPRTANARLAAAVAEAFESEARRQQKRQRRRDAGARGARLGTVCGRWRHTRRMPDLRLSGKWLEEAGFPLGQEYELEVQPGKLTIQAI